MEQRLNQRLGNQIEVVTITGGLTDGVTPQANFGDYEWAVGADECFEEFRARVMAAAESEGITRVVFGGLHSKIHRTVTVQ